MLISGIQAQTPYILLLLSIILLALGPVLYRWFGQLRWLLSGLDGFVLVGVAGFVLIHVMPEAIKEAGFLAVLVAFVGVIAPLLLGRLQRVTERQAHHAAMWLALSGLALHAVLDGVAISQPGNEGTTALAAAILMHRLPVGLMVWIWGCAEVGKKRTVIMLFVLAGATILGFGLGESLLSHPEGTAYALFQALVAGALMHVLLHRHEDEQEYRHAPSRWKWAEVCGAALGLTALYLFPLWLGDAHAGHGHAGHQHTAAHRHVLWSHIRAVALVCAPPLLLGYLLTGLLSSFLPTASLPWLKRGKPAQQAARGVLFGLPLPICSCGVVPVYQRLLQQGAPATAALAFLIATPELGLESLLLSLPLLGIQLTLARLFGALILAWLLAWLLGSWLLTKETSPPVAALDPSPPVAHRWTHKLRDALRISLSDVVEDTGAWVMLGIATAAMLTPGALRPLLMQLPPGGDLLLFGLLGIPFYVCASGATPLAAALIYAGASPGAALAFLLAGPVTNTNTFALLSKLHSSRVATLFGLGMWTGALALGALVNTLPNAHVIPFNKTLLHTHGTPLQWLCLIILGVAFSVAILRQGPIRFVWSIFAFGRQPYHDHDHDHDHDHTKNTRTSSTT